MAAAQTAIATKAAAADLAAATAAIATKASAADLATASAAIATKASAADLATAQAAIASKTNAAANLAPNRAAVVDFAGRIASASGGPGDCVRVDGSSGPCGTGDATSYTKSFTAATTVTVFGIEHGLHTAQLRVTCYDSDGKLYEPDTITIDAETLNVVITHAIPQSGRCVLQR